MIATSVHLTRISSKKWHSDHLRCQKDSGVSLGQTSLKLGDRHLRIWKTTLSDYYSKFIGIDDLKDLTRRSTMDDLKSQFCRQGLPDILRSDNRPQISEGELRNVCYSMGTEYTMSSPAYPQSSGEAERRIQTVKKLWRKSKDKKTALRNYRAMKSCVLSPATLRMSRRPQNKQAYCERVVKKQQQSTTPKSEDDWKRKIIMINMVVQISYH